jgi:tetratricopeptide (TPR) repeat protein
MLQGQALEALDRYEESSAASQSALMLMDEMPPVDMAEERVIAARTLASAHLHLGHYDEAFRALNNAHSLLPKENVLQHAAILRTFGTLFYARGQLTEAVTFGEQALKLAQQSGESREIARVTAMLSTVALDRGAFADALDYSEAVLQTNRQQGNLYYQVLDLRQIATVYRCLFAYDLSMVLCDEAEALQARIDYHDPLLKTNRALNLIALGQPDIGLRILRETAGLTYQNVQTSWRVQLALVNGLGIIGDYDLCRAVAAELAEITREQNEVIYGRAQLWLGIALTGLGDVEGAWMALYDALQYEQTQGGRDLWLCYQALSRLNTEYHARMADTLRGMANSLQSRPDLHTALINSPIFRSL